MAAYTIEVNERSTKAKHFVQFIEDYAKDNAFISIEKSPKNDIRKSTKIARNERSQPEQNTDPEWNNALTPKSFRKKVHTMLKNKFNESKVH